MQLTLVGTGTEHSNLKNYVVKNRLKDKVSFIESINNSKYLEILQKHDALIVHSNITRIRKNNDRGNEFKETNYNK